MSGRTTSRRERLRLETTREITSIALRQMAADGPGAISLRGIAREMGMTARAIYSYFPTRDDLITALVSDVGSSLARALEASLDDLPTADPTARLLAWGKAFRSWAMAEPQGFRLIYGDPIPGYQTPTDGPSAGASRRICGGLNRLVAAAYREAATTPVVEADWSAFPPTYLTKIQSDVPELSPAAAAAAVRIWGRMHGLVSLEIYGHLQSVATDPAALYDAELRDIIDAIQRPPH